MGSPMNAETQGQGRKVRDALDPLGEETDDEKKFSTDDDSDSDDEEARRRLREEINKFEMLCDGVQTALALVNNSLAEFLDVKDELLRHSLPPALLAKLAMIAGKVYRSTADLNSPATELVRLVRIYAQPWEEKSTALKKLHSDYESKHRQLNIAIRRLQVVDTQAKKIEHDRRIMNWEKLFAALTTSKGHGRRWRFLIDTFREKSKLGMEHLQEYLDSMDKGSEKEEDETEEEEVQEEEAKEESQDSDEFSSDDLELSGSEEDGSLEATQNEANTEGKPRRRVSFGGVEETFIDDEEQTETEFQVKVETEDKCVWTHEPEYDNYLNLRVYRPLGLDEKNLRCTLTFGKSFIKTDAFKDPEPQKKGAAKKKEAEKVKEEEPKRTPPRSMIGSRGKTPPKAEPEKPAAPAPNDDKPQKINHLFGRDLGSYHHVSFLMPEKPAPGVKVPEELSETLSNLKVAVHHGKFEEMVGMTSLDVEEFESLSLLTFDSEAEVSDDLEKVPFQLFGMKTSKKENLENSVGTLPLSIFWTKTLKPRSADRGTDAWPLNDLVLDATGIDLETVDLDDLHRYLQRSCEDVSVAAMSIQEEEEEKEETVSLEEVEKMKEKHSQAMEIIQDEYEKRLAELARRLDDVQAAQFAALAGSMDSGMDPRKLTKTATPLHGWAQTPRPPGTREKPSLREQSPLKTRPRVKVGQTLPKWGSDLPEGFLERLKLLTDLHGKKKEELLNKTREEIAEKIEMQMAGHHRLAQAQAEGATIKDPVEDVCLPAVFMPTRLGQLYNPRAHLYFHPTGSVGSFRLTQPPSMFQLPPLPEKNKLNVVNLFDISKNFEPAAPDNWLTRPTTNPAQYLSQPATPAPTLSHSAVNTPMPAHQEQRQQASLTTAMKNSKSFDGFNDT